MISGIHLATALSVMLHMEQEGYTVNNENKPNQINYPQDAAMIRDLIKDMLMSQSDTGSSADTGGGLGSADLWMTFGNVEYLINVRTSRILKQ